MPLMFSGPSFIEFKEPVPCRLEIRPERFGRSMDFAALQGPGRHVADVQSPGKATLPPRGLCFPTHLIHSLHCAGIWLLSDVRAVRTERGGQMDHFEVNVDHKQQ